MTRKPDKFLETLVYSMSCEEFLRLLGIPAPADPKFTLMVNHREAGTVTVNVKHVPAWQELKKEKP